MTDMDNAARDAGTAIDTTTLPAGDAGHVPDGSASTMDAAELVRVHALDEPPEKLAATDTTDASAFLEGRDIPDDQRPVYDFFARSMDAMGTAPVATHSAMDWLQGFKPGGEPQAAAHGYDLRNFNFPDPVGLNDFANHMARAGVSESDVYATLRWYEGILSKVGPVHTAPTGGRAPAAAPAGVDAQIAQIEEVLRSDRMRYNKDESMQARYRQLLVMKHGG